jgi:hypothetical protein
MKSWFTNKEPSLIQTYPIITAAAPPKQGVLTIRNEAGKSAILDFSGDSVKYSGDLPVEESAKIFFTALYTVNYSTIYKLKTALKKCLDLIKRDYSSEEASALQGHPISIDARKEWDEGWKAYYNE